MGLGNSTRCLSIMENLKIIDKSTRIIVFTSGNGSFFFKNNKLVEKVYNQKQLSYSKKGNKLSVLKTILNIKNYLNTFNQNTKKILELENKYEPNLIFTDSFYFFPYLKKKIKCKILSLNNSNEVINSFLNNKIKKKISILPQLFLIEFFDYLFHYFLTDIIISPYFSGKNKMINKKIFSCTPIIRNKLSINNSKNFKPIIMLSGSSFSSKIILKKELGYKFKTMTVIGKKKISSSKKLKFIGKKKENIQILNSSNSGIINAGFSAVSEFYLLKKPCVVIPVKGHSEQYYNAKFLENLGVAIYSCEEQMFNDLSIIKNNYKQFYKAAQKIKDKNSSYLVAKFILNKI